MRTVQAESTPPSIAIDVVFRKQGGITTIGSAIGRMGSKRVLIQYSTAAGEHRERWIHINRLPMSSRSPEDLEAIMAALPAYKKAKCPGTVLQTPIPFGDGIGWNQDAFHAVMIALPWTEEVSYSSGWRIAPCTACGHRHELLRDWDAKLVHGLKPLAIDILK